MVDKNQGSTKVYSHLQSSHNLQVWENTYVLNVIVKSLIAHVNLWPRLLAAALPLRDRYGAGTSDRCPDSIYTPQVTLQDTTRLSQCMHVSDPFRCRYSSQTSESIGHLSL